MVSGFICGSSSFPREEDDFYRQTRSADSSPRRHCRLLSLPSRSSTKNPYSNRGLDKFSALLAEIEEKRQQIYSQNDPDEISLVRFVCSPDRSIKPIVVKAKTKSETEIFNQNLKKTDKSLPDQHRPKNETLTPKKLSPSLSMPVLRRENRGEICRKQMGFYGKLGVYGWKWNDPRFYLPVAIILILGVLMLFGRACAIMCTSIGWYAIPSITSNDSSSSDLRKSFKKKDFAVRRVSEKRSMRKEGTVSFRGFTEVKKSHH